MTKALPAPRAEDTIQALTSELHACANKVLNRAFGPDTFVISGSEQADPAEPNECLWAEYEFTPELGRAAFGLERSAALELGHRLLRAKKRASEHDHHALHATKHLMGQIADELATSLASRLNAGVESADLPDGENPGSFAASVPLALADENRGSSYVLFVRPSAEFLAVFSGPASDSNRNSAPAPASSLRNLDVLLDVEMPVSISFGSTRMPLKEVARLNSGSTIELNRPLSEPIQIVVNNCSIARGEVIVVDGKFAVRITDIVSRQDRLRSLT